jgi:signal transduction histidine kinase/ligand-binding sensor domain-containing protein
MRFAWLFTAGSLLLAGGASAHQFSITNWGHKDGLSSTTVYAVTQTGDGFLWLATGDGLIRFDGFQFTSLEPPVVGPQSRGRITALSPTGAAGLLIGTANGVLLRRDASASASVELDSAIEHIRVLADHAIDVDTQHKVFLIANTNLAIISTADRPEDGSGAPDISRDADHQVLQAFSREHTIRNTLRDNTGAWWIATENQGLFRIARDGETQQFTRAMGLPSDHIWDIFQDREGNIWAGTQNGLARLRQDKFITYTVRNGLQSDIATALAPAADNGIWLGSRSGLQHFTVPGNANETLLQGVAVADLLALESGTLLAATSAGIREVSQQEIQVTRAFSGFQNIELAAQSQSGDLWFYARHELWYCARGAQPQLINEPALATHVVLSMRGGPRDEVWLGLNDGTVILRPPAGSHVFTSADGLTGAAIRFLSPAADGRLWVATDKGLAYFDGVRFRHWDRSSGLPVDRLLWVVPDEHGSLWLGSNTGVVRLRVSALLHPASRSAQLQYDFYDDGDGLKSNPESYGSRPVALTSDGRLWVSMSEGISMIDPTQPARDSSPPPVHILGFYADGHDLGPSNGLRIPANTRTLQITYTGISLTEPRKVRFRYRLDGFDRGWQDVGRSRQAVYTNLPPGHYVFQVLAASGGETWNDAGDAVTFELLPAFYQTLWFVALCGLVVLTLCVLVYRLRIRLAARELSARYEERIAERTRLAQDLHDSLVQEILGISLQLEIAEEVTPPGSRAREPLGRALDLSRTALANGRSALHVLRRRPFRRIDIENTLSDTAQSMTGSAEVVQFDSSGTERLIRAAAAEELVQIVREALRNAIRHAGQKKVSVCSDYGDQHLAFVVRDSGPGISDDFLHNGKPGHFGIRGMRERATHIGASLTVNTSPGAGTEWTLRVPGAVAYEPDAVGRQHSGTLYGRLLGRLLRSRAQP